MEMMIILIDGTMNHTIARVFNSNTVVVLEIAIISAHSRLVSISVRVSSSAFASLGDSFLENKIILCFFLLFFSKPFESELSRVLLFHP